MISQNIKSILDKINYKNNLIKKANKKTIINKFKNWLKMDNSERNKYIEEFNNLTQSNIKFYTS